MRLGITLIGLSMMAGLAQAQVADGLRSCPRPEWPRLASINGDQGRVTLQFVVDRSGEVQDTLIVASTGSSLLDAAAEAALSKCKFSPQQSDQAAPLVRSEMQYEFTQEVVPERSRFFEMRSAALAGNAEAMYRLSEYVRMLPPPQNQAADGLRLNAAAAGWPMAQLALGTSLLQVADDAEKRAAALRWIRQAAVNGFADAQRKLGRELIKAPAATAAELAEGETWLQQAAAQYPDLFCDLAARREKAAASDQDWKAVAQLYLAGAEKKAAHCAFALSGLYQSGRGVATDPDMAARWLQRAVDGDYLPALSLAARQYQAGPKPDPVIARQLFEKGAKRGDAYCQWELARVLQLGIGGDADAEASMKWLRRAAAAGEKPAVLALARAYRSGSGVAANLELARQWYARAVASGDTLAAQELAQLNQGS